MKIKHLEYGLVVAAIHTAEDNIEYQAIADWLNKKEIPYILSHSMFATYLTVSARHWQMVTNALHPITES